MLRFTKFYRRPAQQLYLWRIPRNLPLADPESNVRQGVDVIIGAELFLYYNKSKLVLKLSINYFKKLS